MDGHIVAVYCLQADLLRALGHRDDGQCHLPHAEVMTIALVAAMFFGGNSALTCYFLHEQGYMRRMLSPSRFNRRLHRVKDLFLTLFAFIGEHWKEVNSESVYIIDSFPIASCDNIRIKRSRRYQGEDYRGYIASKRRYFYGVRLHLVVTARGEPVEFFLTPGAESDTGALQWYQFDLPAGSKILGDKAFNVYAIEDDLASIGIELCPLRKKNSTRTIPPWETYLRELHRKYIETAGSLITQRFPKTIHAVTAAGFELKIVLFLLAYSFDCLAR
jgi:hypothetical protein